MRLCLELVLELGLLELGCLLALLLLLLFVGLLELLDGLLFRVVVGDERESFFGVVDEICEFAVEQTLILMRFLKIEK